jgi:hypothetical protein
VRAARWLAVCLVCHVTAFPAWGFILDGDLPIDSKNKRFQALPGPGDTSTVVRRRLGPKTTEKVWAKPGWNPVAFLSDDGEYLVTGYEGNNLLNHKHAPDEVMLTFFRRGAVIGSIRLNEIILDEKHLEVTDSGVFWGFYEGFLASHRLAVDTVEQRRLVYDVTTGALVQVVPSPSPLVVPASEKPSSRSRTRSPSGRPRGSAPNP